MKRTAQIYSFFLIALIFVACKDRKEVDVSKIELDISIERFDKDLSTLTAENAAAKSPELQKKYGQFYVDFMSEMLSVGDPADPYFLRNLQSVLNNPDYENLKKEIRAKFPDLGETEEELENAFKHVKYYYPEQKIPKVVAFFSGFSVQTPIGNDYIGIGLDMFLGANSKFYPALRQSIPLYISRRFTPENITPRVMETFVREEMFPEPDSLNTYLDRMIYNGKIMYFMDAVMPKVVDSLKIGYSAQQQEWADNFEPQIWGYFLEQNLVYETDFMKIQKYLSEAPFTPGIGERNESAPKLGIFIGWQIVKAYMDENPKLTLQELMKTTDYQMILNKSKYKPK
ncbi:gliding motility lipoprotein GldB [Pedobacter sp. SYSU D00535]|uniref:gliding motility lipoprotein GldB n=1 Tax=Pedobacter sp. SYSU D00535 TaxID=2810308 RepID=UPI001A9667EE|nr:gliding motility lipoprotein GldB [Pedobacter sp. SYSU D00535]